jgi:hypothetical protein
MEALIQILLGEISTTVTSSFLLEVAPRLIKEAQKLAVPGAEKKAAVLKALHDLVGAMKECGKISEVQATEFDSFIDETVTPTVDLLIAAYKDVTTFSAPKTVEEVQQKVNCLAQFIQAVLCIVKKTKVTKEVIKTEVEAPKVEEAKSEETKAPEEAKSEETKAAEVASEVAAV